MTEINFHHLDLFLLPFNEEYATHYGYLPELNQLNLSLEEQAVVAIEKWVQPLVRRVSEAELLAAKEALRFSISKGRRYTYISFHRPGIDDVMRDIDMSKYLAADLRFSLTLWRVIFDEPFVPAVLKNYLHRVDESFANFPGDPNKWGAPEYKDWYWPPLTL